MKKTIAVLLLLLAALSLFSCGKDTENPGAGFHPEESSGVRLVGTYDAKAEELNSNPTVAAWAQKSAAREQVTDAVLIGTAEEHGVYLFWLWIGGLGKDESVTVTVTESGGERTVVFSRKTPAGDGADTAGSVFLFSVPATGGVPDFSVLCGGDAEGVVITRSPESVAL